MHVSDTVDEGRTQFCATAQPQPTGYVLQVPPPGAVPSHPSRTLLLQSIRCAAQVPPHLPAVQLAARPGFAQSVVQAPQWLVSV